MQLLGEFYDLKSKLLESKENIIKDIEGRTIDEKPTNIISWLMFHDVLNESKASTPFDSKTVNTVKGGKHQKETKKSSNKVKKGKKLSQSHPRKKKTTCKKSIGCRIRMLVEYGDNDKMNSTIITIKEEVNYNFFIREGTK